KKPWRAKLSSIWSRNGTPVAIVLRPAPSSWSAARISVSRVLRSTVAARGAPAVEPLAPADGRRRLAAVFWLLALVSIVYVAPPRQFVLVANELTPISLL